MTSKDIRFSEEISVYDLKKPEISVPMNRKEFYTEQMEVFKETGKPTKAVEIADLMLFTPKKEIILQKRSPDKPHNPYLIDKAVGGHVNYGDLPSYTMMIETVQELRVPSVVLRTEEDFIRTYKTLETYLEHVAVIQHIDEGIFLIDNIIKGERITFAKKVQMFFGVYMGATKPVDHEASGVMYYGMDFLRDEMKATPDTFTPDMHFFMKKYEKEMKNFLKEL